MTAPATIADALELEASGLGSLRFRGGVPYWSDEPPRFVRAELAEGNEEDADEYRVACLAALGIAR